MLDTIRRVTDTNVIVIGGGHAGVEAACAAARMGVPTTLITLRKDGIGQMSCNPAIGGIGKGHLVKEVDALGGIMGKAIDATGIQFRTLNASKGPAVRASRAQADRDLYKTKIRALVEAHPNITIIEAEVAGITTRTDSSVVTGVNLKDGSWVPATAVVLTSGTFLRGLMHTGENKTEGGRRGDLASNSLSDSLRSIGFPLGRLKTGTPARLRRSTIDFSTLEEQPGEVPAKPFSIMTKEISQQQISCWITRTSEEIHEVIRANKERSPMFNGQIKSGGPRYCPSIEDKVFRFSDKNSHQIFLEPEGYTSDIVYPNGISTSLPYDVQEKFIRMIKGLERVEILAPGYAVEYDMVDPRNLRPSFETKAVSGLFFAGQINGTSGYEEAAAQGIIAGINAARFVQNAEPLFISRGQAYLGVMIDDLITHGVDEPYRMFTSRAEYRLALREDNADARLTPLGIALGVIPDEQRRVFEARQAALQRCTSWAESTRVNPTDEVNSALAEFGSTALKDSITVATLLRRPELTLERIHTITPLPEQLDYDVASALEVQIKFSGYLQRQEQEISRLKREEDHKIPPSFSYDEVPSLRTEARERLKRHRPESLGHAMRIPGITPATVSLLAVFLKRHKEAYPSHPD